MLMNEKLLNQANFKSFQPCKVAKFHTNPYNFVACTCLPNPNKLSILGDI